jgi:hypothetical protein
MLVAFLSGALFAGCTNPHGFVREKDAAAISRARELFAGTRVDNLKATHRAIVTIRGREFALTGHVSIENGVVAFAATNDLGTTVLSVARNAEGVRITKAAPGFPERAVVEGALRDIETIYTALPSDDAGMYRKGRTGFFYRRAFPHPTDVFIVDLDTGVLKAYREFRFAGKVYDVKLEDYPAEGPLLPGRITITNKRIGYKAEITVVESQTKGDGSD